MTNFSSSLHTHFGFTSFRAGQGEAIQSLLNKQHTLAIMPTGAGKSLIYQFAALQLEGLTLVISPLIALMKDQVDGTKSEIDVISAGAISTRLRCPRTPAQCDLPPFASKSDPEPARR
jgi:ATP-dependent DNA helicase RecQ